jgi:hypothetical protein
MADQQALQQEFHTLVMLFALVMGINNGAPYSRLSFNEAYQGAFEKPLPNHRIAMNAVAAALVRNDEVVAAVLHKSPDVIGYNISAVGTEDGNDVLGDEDFLQIQRTVHSANGFSTIANPNHKDVYYKQTDPGFCTLAAKGTSHWDNVRQNKWHGLTLP